MVTLLVGPDEQRMAVHSEFLTQDSRFFQAALKEEWLNGEGQSREIRLPDESPVYMAYYAHLMPGLSTSHSSQAMLAPVFGVAALSALGGSLASFQAKLFLNNGRSSHFV